MKYVGYYNGEISEAEELKIPMLDRSIYFGDGIYDATTFANRRMYGINDHMDRFFNGCREVEIPVPLSREELLGEMQKCIDAADDEHGLVYWQYSRGTAVRRHGFDRDMQPNLLILVIPGTQTPFDSRWKLFSVEDTRFFHCNVKTLNLLPNVLAVQHCEENGCQEVLFHRGDRVTECAHSSVVILKDGTLQAPPRDNLVLPSISVKHLRELAAQEGIPVREEPFTVEELMNADEVIIASSGNLCIRAVEVDGQPVGGKDPETLRTLQEAYRIRYEKETGYRIPG